MSRPSLILAVALLLAVGGFTFPGATPAAGQTVPAPTTGSVDAAVLAALTPADLPVGCVEPNRHLTLYVVELAEAQGRVRLGYGVTPESASYPGPTIEMIEGECLAVTVVNQVTKKTLAELRDDPVLGLPHPDPDYPLGVSLHVHGVKYTTTSDGTMHTGSWVPPGQARTYVWYAEPRSVAGDGRVLSHGTAGYWWYHDHVVGTDHGTGGVGSGLFGALVVRRAGDRLPDRTYVVALGDNSSINLRTHPATDTCDPVNPTPSPTCFVAHQGDVVEFVVFGIGNDFHTFHLHGHTWVDNRHGMLTPTDEATRVVDVISLGPSASFGFQITAGASVGTGDWMLHCHVQAHSDLGMMTFLHVVPRETLLPTSTSVDTIEHDTDVATQTRTGSRFRGAATLPQASADRRRTLGYYCSLPLTPSGRGRPAAPQA